MYPVHIVGSGPVTQAMIHLARRSGFDRLTWDQGPHLQQPPAYTLPANQTRILQAILGAQFWESIAHQPDRLQIRLAQSDYLLAELPLGRFYQERYGAPLLNIEADALHERLQPENLPQAGPSMVSNPSQQLVIDTSSTENLQPGLNWQVYSHFTPGQIERANISWLSDYATLFRFSTQAGTWLMLVSAQNAEYSVQPEDWPAAVRDGVAAMGAPQIWQTYAPRVEWLEGHYVYAGQACYPAHPQHRETWLSGIEDAWVLSRMMENYEDDGVDGWTEYVKYRQPRINKIAAHNDTATTEYLQRQPGAKLLRNMALAFRTRFLPEIAMQRQDWFHQYDCIRGFH